MLKTANHVSSLNTMFNTLKFFICRFLFAYRTVVFMQDLESALSYSFRQEIAIHKSIEGESLQALKDLIKVLTKV